VRLGRRALLELAVAAAARLALPRPARAAPADDVEAVLAYHRVSRHRAGRLAPGPTRVDWDDQADPYRRFAGAPLLPLDDVAPAPAPTWDDVAAAAVPPHAVDRAALSQLLHGSLAISAWKESGRARWSLRVNPSSGNLHPTEAYVVGGPFPGLTDAPALLHHAPREHGLELRARLPADAWAEIAAALPPRAFLVALTTIAWREAWKYGERGWRYCLLDAGHAVAALAVAAAALGWRARVLEGWADADVARLTGVDRQQGLDAERPAALLAIWPGERWPLAEERASRLPASAAAALADLPLAGTPTPVGGDPVVWPASEAAARAAPRERPPAAAFWAPPPPAVPRGEDRAIPARALVRGRRSALAFDRAAPATRDQLLRVLARTLPAATPAIFAALPWRPFVDLAVLVHRVDGLSPGVHHLPRDAAAGGGPPPLAAVSAREVRAAARAACCDQDVAADGAFTVAMLAPLEETLRAHGAWAYRTLHVEAGAIGQALYLEAEAVGLRGTAMGCFLDDEVRRLARADPRLHPLFTFAVGRARPDARLRPAR
jgi:SagB-type dehydrogenase family enzyme